MWSSPVGSTAHRHRVLPLSGFSEAGQSEGSGILKKDDFKERGAKRVYWAEKPELNKVKLFLFYFIIFES